jgi:hypothetical protein
MKSEKPSVQPVTFFIQNIRNYFTTVFPQSFYAFPENQGIGIMCANYYPGDFIGNDQIGTGRGFSDVGARLKINVKCRFLQQGFVLYRIYCIHLGMRSSGLPVKAFPNYFIIENNYRTYQRIGTGGT